jgi:hypothetical protein
LRSVAFSRATLIPRKAGPAILLSIGLVLISTLPLVETWFDGIDRAAIWHRRVAITGTLLLIPHILLAKNPHGGGSGKLLAIAGALGLLALVIWAIVPLAVGPTASPTASRRRVARDPRNPTRTGHARRL